MCFGSAALGVLAFAQLSGCASMKEADRKRELTAILGPLVGHSREDVVNALGAPTEIMQVGTIEILKYHVSYGERGTSQQVSTTTIHRSREKFDEYNVYLQNGVVTKWDDRVQR